MFTVGCSKCKTPCLEKTSMNTNTCSFYLHVPTCFAFKYRNLWEVLLFLGELFFSHVCGLFYHVREIFLEITVVCNIALEYYATLPYCLKIFPKVYCIHLRKYFKAALRHSFRNMPLGCENSENICDLRVFIGKMNSILDVLSGVFSLTLLTLDCFSFEGF